MLSIAFGLNRLDEQTPARQTRHHTVGALAGVGRRSRTLVVGDHWFVAAVMLLALVLAGINAWWLMRAPAAITTGFSLLP